MSWTSFKMNSLILLLLYDLSLCCTNAISTILKVGFTESLVRIIINGIMYLRCWPQFRNIRKIYPNLPPALRDLIEMRTRRGGKSMEVDGCHFT